MKLRYFVLVTVAAALTAACADSPTASKTRTPTQVQLVDGDTTTRSGGTYGSGH